MQGLIDGILNGELFPDDPILPKGAYRDALVLPAGCDVLLNAVYFELDRHGTDGTLEKIVNVWNNDFRKYKKNVTVKWIREDGSRKPLQKGFDGSDPVWYSDPDGTVADPAGVYTEIRYTKAVEITDCVRADGAPIDLKLRCDLVYPTRPEKDVPVVLHFGSAQYLPEAVQRPVRPQFTGFLFSGYAGAVVDYAYIPMCRNDHYGYFDGSSGEDRGVTGFNPSFSTYVFNATQASTAAVRFLRCLSLSDHETYRLDRDRIGAFGVSKTSFITHLGAPYLREGLLSARPGESERELAGRIDRKLSAFYQWMYLPGHHGETRYAAGKTETYVRDGFTVSGGEAPPWSVFNGGEVPPRRADLDGSVLGRAPRRARRQAGRFRRPVRRRAGTTERARGTRGYDPIRISRGLDPARQARLGRLKNRNKRGGKLPPRLSYGTKDTEAGLGRRVCAPRLYLSSARQNAVCIRSAHLCC